MTLPQIDARPANPADSERRAQAPIAPYKSPDLNKLSALDHREIAPYDSTGIGL